MKILQYCWIRSSLFQLKMFPCESIFPQDQYFPKAKKFTKGIYIPQWECVPQTEKYSLNKENFLPEGIFSSLGRMREYFPSAYPGPSASWGKPFGKLPVSADKDIHLWGSPKILTWEFEKNIPPKIFEGKYSPDSLEGNIPSEMFVREDFPCSLNNWLGFTECENFPV